MSALTGNFAALKELERRIAAVGREGYKRVEQEAAKSVAHVLEEQFSTGSGPDGNAWAALAPSTVAQGRTPPPLTKTGKMRNSATASPIKGVRVRIAKPAGYHQSGTGRMPARQLVPSGNTLPTRWKSAVSEAAMKVLRERFA